MSHTRLPPGVGHVTPRHGRDAIVPKHGQPWLHPSWSWSPWGSTQLRSITAVIQIPIPYRLVTCLAYVLYIGHASIHTLPVLTRSRQPPCMRSADICIPSSPPNGRLHNNRASLPAFCLASSHAARRPYRRVESPICMLHSPTLAVHAAGMSLGKASI